MSAFFPEGNGSLETSKGKPIINRKEKIKPATSKLKATPATKMLIFAKDF